MVLRTGFPQRAPRDRPDPAQTTSRTLSFNTVDNASSCVLLATGECFGEMQRLLGVDLAGHGRLVRIDDGLDKSRPGWARSPREERIPPASGSSSREARRHRNSRATPAKSMGWSSTPNSRIALEHHLLPLDHARATLFLMTMTFTFRLYLRSVASSPISMVNPPSPTMHTTWRPGYAIGRADAVRQPVRHRGQRPGQGELHVPANLDVARGPGRDRSAVGRDDGIIGQELVRARR